MKFFYSIGLYQIKCTADKLGIGIFQFYITQLF